MLKKILLMDFKGIGSFVYKKMMKFHYVWQLKLNNWKLGEKSLVIKLINIQIIMRIEKNNLIIKKS